MSILTIISKIPNLRQDCLIIFTSAQVTGENLRTGKKSCLSRLTKHPRTLAGDYFSLETEINKTLNEIVPRKWIKSKILICLDEGGYTNIELRAFREAGYSAGAMEVYLADRVIHRIQAVDLLINGKSEVDNA